MNRGIKDCFEVRAGAPGVRHAPGIVVVIDLPAGDPDAPGAGAEITLERPDGSTLQRVVDEVKDHGPARSLFFQGLGRGDVPSGSRIRWGSLPPASPASRQTDRLPIGS